MLCPNVLPSALFSFCSAFSPFEKSPAFTYITLRPTSLSSNRCLSRARTASWTTLPRQATAPQAYCPGCSLIITGQISVDLAIFLSSLHTFPHGSVLCSTHALCLSTPQNTMLFHVSKTFHMVLLPLPRIFFFFSCFKPSSDVISPR